MNRYTRSASSKGLSSREARKSRGKYGRIKRTSHTGPGYSKDKTGSEYKFTIRIDYSNYVTNMEQAKRMTIKSMNDISQQLKKEFASKMGNQGIRFIAQHIENGAYKLNSEINAFYGTEKFRTALFNNYASDVGRMGVANIRDGIRKPAGRPTSFRYETGTMFDKVDFEKRKNVNSLVIDIGWQDFFYKYFDYQERGTSKIGGMRAIRRAYRRTTPDAQQLLLRFMRNYTEKGGFSGWHTR